MDSLVSELGDSLTPSIMPVSFQRAGLYNEFYRMRCIEQLPSRVEQAQIGAETKGDCMSREQSMLMMTDSVFLEEVKKREARGNGRKKGEERSRVREERSRGSRGDDKTGGVTGSTFHISTLHPSIDSLSSHPLSEPTFPKRIASVELADHLAELQQLKILYDDDSDDVDAPPTSRRGRIIKQKAPWTPPIVRHLHPSTL